MELEAALSRSWSLVTILSNSTDLSVEQKCSCFTVVVQILEQTCPSRQVHCPFAPHVLLIKRVWLHTR
jgi:hypothetical protein